MAKKLKNYEVLVKALDNFPLVSLDINVLRKGENVFKKVKESMADGWPRYYLSFVEENNEPFTLNTVNTSKSWDGTLYYSTNTKNWAEWNGTEINSSSDGKLYLRGISNSKISDKIKNRFVLTDGKHIQCKGNIETLLDYKIVEAGKHPVMGASCFMDMFKLCSSIVDVSELKLPATTLVSTCYSGLFIGTSITTAPELPATTLAYSCYNYMFEGCTSLTTVPKLPATTLAESCYRYMFSGCTSLTKAPILPATTLALLCYEHMFNNCTSLTTAPSLPATTLAQQCYVSMFGGCTSLTTAPNLPATKLADRCYNYMFKGCSKLTGKIHCAKSTSSDNSRLTSNDIWGSKATIVFDL